MPSPIYGSWLQRSNNLSDVASDPLSRDDIGIPKIFNVKTDYGAVGDGSTDDTTAIQNAINAVATAGGGTVYFPNGVYIVGGALQDTSGANAQLTLPNVPAPGTQQYTIRFLGESPVSQIPWFLTSPAGNTPSSGVVLKSTLASGTGALLGGYSSTAGYQNFTNITPIIENIDVRMHTNPTNSALDFYYCNSAVVKNSVVDSGNWIGNTITQPTTATSYGIRLPQNNNGGNVYLDQVQIIGFYTGLLAAEHTVAGQVEIYHCNVAAEFALVGHSSQFRRLLYANCVRGLKWTGAHGTRIDILDIEHTDQAVWYATTYDIDDASNYARGAISFLSIQSNVGYLLALLRNGGNNLMLNCLNAGQLPYTTFLGNDLSADASIYTNGSYLALNSKSGANPLYLNFRNSNASATIDIFNGNAVVTQPGNLALAGLTASSFIETDSSKVLVSKTAAQMRTDLGLVIGTNVQAYDADLDTWATITPGTGVGTFLATPSSANLASAVTDETGSGSLVFATSPALTGPITTTGTPGSTGLFNVSGDTTSNPLLFVDNYKSSGALTGNTISFRAARGTSGSPSAVQNGDFLWSISTLGYGTNAYSANRLSLSGLAQENWSNSLQGAYFSLRATPAGQNNTFEGLRLGYSALTVFMLGFPTLNATANANIYSDTSYLVLNSKNGANPLYLNFDNVNSGSTVNFHNGTFVVSQPGKVTKYNNITTVSSGVPSEIATIDSTGLTANVAASTLYAVPASGAGLYRVSAYLVTTTAASVSSTMPNAQVVYTDSDSNTSVTLDVSPILGAAGLGQSGLLTANVVGTVFSGTVVVYIKASTTIQYQTVNYASTAAGMAYALRMKLEAL